MKMWGVLNEHVKAVRTKFQNNVLAGNVLLEGQEPDSARFQLEGKLPTF